MFKLVYKKKKFIFLNSQGLRLLYTFNVKKNVLQGQAKLGENQYLRQSIVLKTSFTTTLQSKFLYWFGSRNKWTNVTDYIQSFLHVR